MLTERNEEVQETVSAVAAEGKELGELRRRSYGWALDEIHKHGSSIVMLTVQLKEIEDHYDAAHNAMEQRVRELAVVEESVQSRVREVEEKERAVEAREASVAARIKEFEAREREIREESERVESARREAEEKLLSELKSREKTIEDWNRECRLKDEDFRTRIRELELNEKKVQERFKELEGQARVLESREKRSKEKLKELGEREDNLELYGQSLDKRAEKIRKTEEEFTERLRRIEAKEKRCEQSLAEVKEREARVEEQSKEIKLADECYRMRYKELQLKTRDVELKSKRIEEEFRALGERKQRLERRADEVRTSEEMLAKRLREVEVRERQCEQSFKEFKLKEKKFEEWSKELRMKDEQFNSRSRELNLNEKKVEECWMELKLKDKKVEEGFRRLELKEKQLEEDFKVLRQKDEHFRTRLREHEMKEKKFDDMYEEYRLKDKKFEQQYMELGLKEKQVQEQVQEAELENRKILERTKDLELKEKELEDQRKKFELDGKKFAERIQEFELTERKFEEQLKEFNLKEKQSVASFSSHVKVEQPHSCAVDDATDKPMAMGSRVSVLLNMDGKALQMFLNEHWKDLDSLDIAMYALCQSSDPAELVLDAMQGFYPPCLKKGDVEFEEGVVRRSCIHILEQLMKISPEIRPHVSKEAMKLAYDWITKMKATSDHSLEVLGFLLLLAVYGLASAFDTDELLGYLIIVAQYKQTPELIHVLGFDDKINGFIESLIQKKKRIEAVELIYALNLVKDFPPLFLLNDHIKYHKRIYNQACKRKRNKPPEEQIVATNKRISAIRATIKCIKDHKLERAFPLLPLERTIDFLEKQGSLLLDQIKKCSDPNFASSQLDHKSVSAAAPTTPSPSTSLPSGSNCKTRSQEQGANKRRRLSSEEPQKTSVRSTSNTRSTKPPRQQPSGFYRTQGAPYLFSSAGPHGFAGYPPVNIHGSCDYNNAHPYHPWNSVYGGPMPF